MRLLFVCSHLRVGGAQRQWSLLVPELAVRGFEPLVLALEAEGEFFHELRARGVRTRCARMRRRSDLAGLGRALRTAAFRPHVVLSQGVGGQVVGELLSRRAGAAHVAVDHRGPGFRFARHREAVLRVVAPRVDRVVAVTERQIPQLLARRYRRERIRVIPNGVDGERLRPTASRAQLRDRLGVGAGDFVALLLSVLRPEKRADRFVAAVVRAHAADPRVHGLVAGTGTELRHVQRLAAASGPAVRALGHRDDVPDLLAAADAVCLTSDAEAAPMSALEAMAAARPVVSTRVGGVDELVIDGETGILVAPADEHGLAGALVTLARDPARAGELGRRGRARQQSRFRVDRMADAYAETLNELHEFGPPAFPGKARRW
jgi:glycosyltransferase involved in cell wall biosynthesis